MKRKQLARIDLSNPDKPKIIFNSVKAFNSDLMDFKNGSKVWVEVRTYSPQRSLSQNSYLHVIFGIIAEEIGIELEEAKWLLKEKFLRVPLTDKHGNEVHENGEIQFRVRDTSELSKVDMMNFVDQIYRWSLEFLSVDLPKPLEQQELPINNYPTIEL